jgi:hypothetical protein
MITQLTSELNRINQGCGDGFGYRNPETGLLKYSCNKEHLCLTCQKEKETLKKVSIMWTDEMLDEIRKFYCQCGCCEEVIEYNPRIETLIKQLQGIKSLMKKA